MDFCKYKKDFLLFTYFNITSDEVNKKDITLKACVIRAYLDMCRSIRNYKFKAKNLQYIKKNDKQKAEKETFIAKIDDFIKDVVAIFKSKLNYIVKHPEGFNKYHEKICDSIIETAETFSYKKILFEENKGSITYGQAQKWVNMTFKYLLILDVYNIKAIYKNLHIPIDNNILKELYEGDPNREYNGFLIRIADRQNQEYYIKNIKNKKSYKWSTIQSYTDYNNFREGIEACIDEDKFPIEWEADVWLKQAKAKKTGNNE